MRSRNAASTSTREILDLVGELRELSSHWRAQELGLEVGQARPGKAVELISIYVGQV